MEQETGETGSAGGGHGGHVGSRLSADGRSASSLLCEASQGCCLRLPSSLIGHACSLAEGTPRRRSSTAKHIPASLRQQEDAANRHRAAALLIGRMVDMKAVSLPVDVGVLEGVQDAPPAQLVLLWVQGGDQQV